MRTRLAILLIVTIALVIGASVLMTSHFGMRQWPTAPTPETATRVITPSETAGRAATDRDEPAQRAERSLADSAFEGDDPAPAATTPVSDEPREPARREAERRDDRADAEAPAAGTTEAPDQSVEQPQAPAGEPIPTRPAAPVETPHTRDDDVVAPEAPVPTPDLATGGGGEAADDDQKHH